MSLRNRRALSFALGVALALPVTLTSAATAPSATAAPLPTAPRAIGYTPGALNPLVRPVTRSVNLVAGKATTVVLPALPDEAGGALIQVTMQSRGAAALTVADAAKNAPAVRLLSLPRAGTSSTSALVGTRSVVVTASAAVTVQIATMAWVVRPDEATDPLAPGAVGVAVPVMRLDTAKGLGDTWFSGNGRVVQLTGRGGIPTTTVDAVLAHVTLQAKSGASTLSYTANKATNAVLASEAGRQVSTLAYLPVNDRGEVTLQTSNPATVTITPMGWVSSGNYFQRPIWTGGVTTVNPRSLARGTLPAKQTLAPVDVPAGAEAALLVNLQANGSGRVTVGGAAFATTAASVTGLIPAPVRGPRPTLVTTGALTGHVTSVGWVLIGDVNDTGNPSVTIDGGASIEPSLKGDGEFILSGTATDAFGIEGVEVEIPDSGNRSVNARVDPLTGRWSLPYSPPAGTWEVLVTAYDHAGNAASSTIKVTVDEIDPNEMLIAPNSVILNGAQTELVGTLAAATMTYTGATLPFKPGDIVTIAPGSKAPDGAMRKVLAVDPRPGGGWAIYTEQALVGDALRQANFGVTPDIIEPLEGSTARHRPRASVTIEPVITLPYNFTREGEKKWKNESGTLKAEAWIKGATFGDVSLRIKADLVTFFDVPVWGDLRFFQAHFTNTTRVDVKLKGTAGKTKKIIDDWELSPKIDTGAFLAGPVPIQTYLQPKGYVDLQAQLDIKGYAEKFMSVTATYDDDRGGWQDLQTNFVQPLKWRIEIAFDGKAEAGVKLYEVVMIAGLLGPSLDVRLGLLGVEGNASLILDWAEESPICDVTVRLYSQIGVGLGLEVLNPLGENFHWTGPEATWDIDWATWPKEDLCPDPPPSWITNLDDLFSRGVILEGLAQRGNARSLDYIDTSSLSGYVFSTGEAVLSQETVDKFASGVLNSLGSELLDRFVDDSTFDASLTELTIVPRGKTLEIPYRFLSEEYGPEGQDTSKGRDAAVILIDGINCVLTDEGEPVNSSTINAENNAEEFIDNTDADSEGDVVYDGMTTLRLCRIPVKPEVPILVQIIVADVGDPLVDSALFIPYEGIRSY